jgi:hypothetical protein
MTVFAAARKAEPSPRQPVDMSGWLGLAAAPVFGPMAVMSAFGPQGMTMCSAASASGPIDSMALMYLLMGLFHLPPWLRLLSRRSPGHKPHVQGD